MPRWMIPLIGSLAIVAGCGQNKFQKEVKTEAAAVGLARETIAGEYELITTEELKALIDGKADILIVDAMPYEESYRKGHIPGAKHFLFPIPEMKEWDASETGGKAPEDFEEVLGPEKDRPIVIYCGFVKCTRSHNGALWARKLGYRDVKRYPGGIYAWKGAGHPLEMPE